MNELFKIICIPSRDNYLHFSDYKTGEFAQAFDNYQGAVLKVNLGCVQGYFMYGPSMKCANGVVGINSVLASGLGIKTGSSLKITMDHVRSKISKMMVRPVGKDDLVVLDMYKHTIESILMDQVKIVWPGQIMVVWATNAMYIRLFVESLEPAVRVGELQNLTELVINTNMSEIIEDVPKILRTESALKDQKEPWDEDTQPQQKQEEESVLVKLGNYMSFPSLFSKVSESVENPDAEISVVETECSGVESECSGVESAQSSSGVSLQVNVFRVYPLPEIDIFDDNPYEVYIPSKYLSCEHYFQLFKITRLDTPDKMYVLVVPLEEIKDMDGFKFDDSFNLHTCMFVSRTLFLSMSLDVGMRVSVDPMQYSPAAEVMGIKYSRAQLYHRGDPFTDEVDENEEENAKLESEWRNFLKKERPRPLLLPSRAVFCISGSGLPTTLYVKVRAIWPRFKYVILTPDFASTVSLTLDPRVESVEKFEFFKPHEGIFCHAEEEMTTAVNLLRVALHPETACSGKTSNILITGRSGSGVTTFAQAVCNSVAGEPLFVYVYEVWCHELRGKTNDSILTNCLEPALLKCQLNQPAILLLHDIHNILYSMDDNQVSHSVSGSMAWLCNNFKMTIARVQNTVSLAVVATTTSKSNLPRDMVVARGFSLFDCTIQLPDLNEAARELILNLAMKGDNMQLVDSDGAALSKKMAAYDVKDIFRVIHKAVFEFVKTSGIPESGEALPVTNDIVDRVLACTKPMRLFGVDLVEGKIVGRRGWEDIGGIGDVKEVLQRMIMWPKLYPGIFANAPLRMQSGILLYGPPGTGKTLLASVLASTMDVNFISIKGPELLAKYVGQSEQQVRKIFNKARSAKPCILFFDEFDSIASRRGTDSTGATDRVVNQILTELDGIETLSGVWVVGATTRPDLLDLALLRPGRLDQKLRLPMPNEEARLEILEALTRNMNLDEDVDFSVIAHETDGFTGADLQSVLYTAQLSAVEDTIAAHTPLEGVQGPVPGPSSSAASGNVRIKLSHSSIMLALKDTRPSVSKSELARLETIYAAFDSSKANVQKQTVVEKKRITLK